MKKTALRKILVVVGTVAVIAGIIGILQNNKAKSDARRHTDVLTQIPVSITTVEKKIIDDNLSLTGSIAANSDVLVVSETQGRITSVNVRVGQQVGAGTVLCQVDDEYKRAALLAAEAAYDKAKKDFDRFQALAKDGSVTAAQLDGGLLALRSAEAQAITARRQLKDTRVTAPIAGLVSAKMVEQGATLAPGSPVANLVDVSSLKVKLSLAERDAFRIKVGEKVKITTDVYPGVSFTGTVENISAKADDAHTYPAEIRVQNSKTNPLRAGMFARVGFATASNEPQVVVPREALVGSVRDAQVYVIEGDVAHLRPIVVGAEIDGMLTVVSGVRDGEHVVVNGQNNLRDGASVVIVK
jgi:RND family efflux transporter MFP subunit